MTMLGKRQTIETKIKISKAHKGMRKPWAGKYKHNSLSEEHKKRIGIANKGHLTSVETRKKISQSLMGHKHSKETLDKISKAVKGKLSGEKHWNWQGGLSFEPYSVDWTETLKRTVRERDHYICQVCGKQQGDETFDVHHIDYNKKNCSLNNLITLCVNCHMKINFNRKFWLEKFWPVPGWTQEELKQLDS